MSWSRVHFFHVNRKGERPQNEKNVWHIPWDMPQTNLHDSYTSTRQLNLVPAQGHPTATPQRATKRPSATTLAAPAQSAPPEIHAPRPPHAAPPRRPWQCAAAPRL
ncbi:hypothetical protein BC826DRAFT_1054761 [Russula brevipes]|nr:hypothetical protein BC826DRAFT_1054761 [Russula brevipes]